MIAVDTSVVVAALSPWHERHEAAADIVRKGPRLPAQCMIEAYSTLTRLPQPLRISGAHASDALTRQWRNRLLAPSPDLLSTLPARCSVAGVVGGGSYDALVALTAAEQGCSLVSFDRRAERTYRLLGVHYRIFG